MEKPRRRYQLELTLGADDRKVLIGSLNSIIFDLERMEEDTGTESTSGGYDSGYHLSLKVYPDITHDSWYEYLQKYLEWDHERTKLIADTSEPAASTRGREDSST